MSYRVRGFGAACLVTETGSVGSVDIAAAAALVAVVGMVLGTVPEEALTVVEVGATVVALSVGSRSGSVAELLC